MAEFLNPGSFRGVTRLLVMQPTAFCNIGCDYCYLPHRDDRNVMPIEIVRSALRFVFDDALNAPDFTVVWHAGEPLVLRPDWYRRAFAAARDAAPAGLALPHAIQTNGMLIDDRWCDLFLEFGVRVGVSLDGPAKLHDARRKTRSGDGTHAKVMRGIDFLRRRDVPFHVICVVGALALGAADELMDFFEAEGITRVGFNVEEIEGPVKRSSLEQPGVEEAFARFFARAVERARMASPRIAIRERDGLAALIGSPFFGQTGYNSQNAPFAIVTVSSRGELFTFSPELAGLADEEFGNFSIGTLPESNLGTALRSPVFRAMWQDIERGVAKCSETCEYFDLCLGGAPINKLSENGSFASTETMYCRLAHKAVADVVLADIERHVAHQALPTVAAGRV